MLEMLLDVIGAEYPLTGKKDAERRFQAAGMAFEARGYAAQGLGHVGVMTARGLMQMETLVINPFERDAPILSYDRIHAMGQEMMLGEMYDSLLGESFDAQGMIQALDGGGGFSRQEPGILVCADDRSPVAEPEGRRRGRGSV